MKPGPARQTLRTAAALAAVFLVLASPGIARVCQYHRLNARAIENAPPLLVDLARQGLRPQAEKNAAFRFDITSLGLESLSDSDQGDSPLVFKENGVPLTPHSTHRDIRGGQRGCFSHWGNQILFSPSAQTPPTTNVYTIECPLNRAVPPKHRDTPAFRALWSLLAVFGLACGPALRFFGVHLPARPYKGAALLALATTYGLILRFTLCGTPQLPSSWNTFCVAPDSFSYMQPWTPASIRPPLYPWFIRAATALAPAYSLNSADYTYNVPVCDQPQHPLLRVVQAQKMALAAAVCLAALALMRFVPPPLAVLFFMALLDFGFLTEQIDFILSETLAQALLMIILALFFFYLDRPSVARMVCAGAACGALFCVRPAGAFAVFFPAAMFVRGVADTGRRACLSAAAAAALYGAIATAPALVNYTRTGFWQLTNMYEATQLMWALNFAADGDIDLMPDEASRRFFDQAVRELRNQESTTLAALPPSAWKFSKRLNTIFYKVAMPTAVAQGLSTPSDGLNTRNAQATFQKVSRPLLAKYHANRLQVAWNQWTGHASRLAGPSRRPWLQWLILLGCPAAALACGPWVRIAVGTCVAAHLAAVWMVSFNDTPETRYVHATECLVLLGMFILFFALGQSATAAMKRAWKAETPENKKPGA